MSRKSKPLVAPACFLWILVSAAFGGAGREIEIPRIEWGALPAAAVAPAPDLRTGYLVVPERRFPEPTGRSIRLPFVIMKSRASTPRPDPVLVSAGGPGGSILFRALNRSRNPLLDRGDVILLEQRGTHFAEPALMAPRIEEALRSGWGTHLNGDPDPAAVAKAIAETLKEYKKAGIDLAGYRPAKAPRISPTFAAC